MRMTGILRSFGFYLGLFLFCLFAIFPAVWMLITAFKSNADLYNPTNNPFLFNLPPTLSHADELPDLSLEFIPDRHHRRCHHPASRGARGL